MGWRSNTNDVKFKNRDLNNRLTRQTCHATTTTTSIKRHFSCRLDMDFFFGSWRTKHVIAWHFNLKICPVTLHMGRAHWNVTIRQHIVKIQRKPDEPVAGWTFFTVFVKLKNINKQNKDGTLHWLYTYSRGGMISPPYTLYSILHCL